MEQDNVELNPITNLPVRKAPVNPITGKPLTQSQLSSPFTGDPMAYGFTRDMSEYTDYGVRVTPYQDIEEARAQAQPWYEQVGRGVLKASGTLGSTVGMGIGGSFEALIRLGDQFKVGGWDNVNLSRAFGEENEINKYLTQVSEEYRQSIPNYRTQEELQNIGTFRGMFNTNFIFDDALNGFAFLGGAVATAWLTGGTGVSGMIGSGLGATGRLAMLSPRIAAGVNALKASRAAQASFSTANAAKMRAAAFATAVKATPALKAASNLPGAAAAGRVGSKLFSVRTIQGLETGFLMSTSEAAVEAFDAKTQYREKLIGEALKKYNVESEYDLPLQVQQNINQLAENVGAVAFSANLPMLMATNMFTFRQMLRPVLAPRIAGLSMKAGKAVYAPGSKALRVGKVLGTESLSEALQEGYQWGIQETLINQDLNKYNDFGSADMFYGLAKARENDFLTALKKTPELVSKLAEAPFNPEGRQSMILGALIGGVMSGIRLSVGDQFAQEDKRGKAAEEFLNSDFFGNLQKRAARSNRTSTHLKNKEIFEKEGNIEAAERELAAMFQEEALFHVENGSWDTFLERLALEAEKPLDEFKKDFNITDDNYTAEDQKNTIKKLAEQLTDLAIYSDSLSFMFPTIKRPRGLAKTLTSKKRMQEIDDQIKEQEIIRGAILRSHFTIGNLNKKITETAERMKEEIPEIASMIDDIINTRRSLFGELFSKAERAQKGIKDAELYSSIKIKNDELVDKLNKASEGIEDPVHQVLFNIYAQKLIDLAQERDNYELAKNNLVRSPEKRDLFVSRSKLAEANKIFETREKILKESIESAKTSKELSDQQASLGEEINEHPELKLQLSNAITAKLKEENDINERFNGLTLTEVKALTGLTPQEEYVRKLHLGKRSQESPITPKKKEPKKEEKKEPKKEPKKEEKKGKTDAKGKVRNRRKKQGEELRKRVGSLISLRNHNRTTVNQQTFGEFEVEEIDGKSFVVVDGEGFPTEGNPRILNGGRIINHRLMNSPDVKIGDTIELKVIEDDWWTSNPNVPRDHIQAPIYILFKGVPIGILQSGDHPVREAAWNAHINKTGEVISTKITEKNRGYIFNALQVNGESREQYFYNLGNIENDALAASYGVPNVLGVVKNYGKIELNIIPSEEDSFELEAQINQQLSVGGLTPGQVFMLQVAPNGKITVLPLQTATLNITARDKAAQLLGQIDKFKEVVGVTNLSTILDNPQQGGQEAPPLMIEPTSGDIIFRPVGDSVPTSLAQAIEAMGENLFIRIPPGLLKQMWNGEEFKLDQATFLDLLVYVDAKENADGTRKQMFEQYHQKLSTEEYSKLIGELKSQITYIFNDVLITKRHNVNIDILSDPKTYNTSYTSVFTGNVYSNYYEYLKAEEENASERNGTAAILGASFTNINTNNDGSGGSVFYDTEIKLDPEFSINGVSVAMQVEDTPAETYEEETEEAEETQKEPTADSNQPETVDDFLDALLNPQETAAPTTASVSDKKADIERRRQDIISRKSTPQEKFDFLENIPQGTIIKNGDGDAVIIRKKITKRGTESYEIVPLFLNEDGVWEENYGGLKIVDKKANGEFNVNAELPQIFTSDVEIILPTDDKYDAELAALESTQAPVTPQTKTTPVVKIISGGQTGADRLGLEIAKELRIETGGVAPRGYKTESGSDASLKDFGLSEDSSSDYNPRTEKNVKASDATVIFGDINSAGSKLTVKLLNQNNKPYVVNPSAEELSNFLKTNNVKVLNVAGNRGSKLTPSQIESYKNTLRTALQPTQPTTVTKDAKINVKGALVSQGTSIELEIVGDTGKPFLLTVDRKGKITLFSEKQLDGSYIAGEYAPKEAVDKLYNKYVPEKTREAITNWVNAFTGSWAAPETEDGKRFDKVEKSLNAELAALEPTQPTTEEVKPKKERRGPKSFNDFNVEEEEGRDIANRCNDDDPPF